MLNDHGLNIAHSVMHKKWAALMIKPSQNLPNGTWFSHRVFEREIRKEVVIVNELIKLHAP
jgi:hypothetical protein